MAGVFRLTRLNLRRADATSFDFHFRLADSTAGVERLTELLVGHPRVFPATLGRGESAEFFLLSVRRLTEDDSWSVEVRFDTRPPVAMLVEDLLKDEARIALASEAKLAKPTAFLKAIAETGASVEMHCNARFRYSLSTVTPLLRLPFKPLLAGALPFDECRGFRATKLRPDGEVLHSVVVDSFDLETLHHHVFLCKTVDLSGRFIHVAFREAQEISSAFLERTGPS